MNINEKNMTVFFDQIKDQKLISVCQKINQDFHQDCDVSRLYMKFNDFYHESMTMSEILKTLIQVSSEMISVEEPCWEKIAARFLAYDIHWQVRQQMKELKLSTFYQKIKYLTETGFYGSYLLEYYCFEEIEELGKYIQNSRDELFNYSGLDLLYKRYLVRDFHYQVLETPQEMFMGIAMHLAMKEKQRVIWAKQFYDVLSTLKITMATPTMSNARKPFHQMSSCFIDVVDDSLKGIYQSLDHFAQVSKYGGGMGLYFGKVRANGSAIRGYKGAAGGVIRWLKLVNDTAVAVDQLGVRQGAAAVYLDVWHKDLPEFLQIKTNNGDDRMKAHDIFPAVCYPRLFWKLAKDNIDASWYMMCPHEIYQVKGYHLEDYYGEEWESRYQDCVQDERISKRVMSVKEVVRLIIRSLVETGTPFAFNRDEVNEMNPNHHQGMIYCSNLCSEIAQNMQSTTFLGQEIIELNGEPVVIEKNKPGDFVVCNLASLTLGRINVDDEQELQHVIHTTVRALDNVIDLNYYPLPYAQLTNQKYRAIGLGTSGYHHLLCQKGIPFESELHLQFVDQLYEKINYYALEASCALAKEKGSYAYFVNSDYDTGAYFQKRQYLSSQWASLQKDIHQYGLRNGYLMAIAPTSSTSIIAGTTASVDPIMKKFYVEEKKGSLMRRVAPDLNGKTFWLYKNAHYIDQNWIIKAAGIRQRHIDQSQSVNIYMTQDFTFRKLLNLYILASECRVKTIYYVRSQSLEIEECESCSA